MFPLTRATHFGIPVFWLPQPNASGTTPLNQLATTIPSYDRFLPAEKSQLEPSARWMLGIDPEQGCG